MEKMKNKKLKDLRNTALMNKEQIYEFLKNNKGKRFSMKELNEKIENISRATIMKWIDVLLAEKDRDPPVNVDDYGNIKLVWVD